METKKRSCIDVKVPEIGFVKTDEQPDEECINCILDDILNTPEGETRDAWIAFYTEGRMMLNCARTGKSYIVTKEFFNNIQRKNYNAF